jgi:serine/threonine protein phosphatase PrpC
VPRAIETVTTALNRWVIAEGTRNSELAGMATTLSVLVLRGRRFYTAHIGDSRIYRLHEGTLQQMTVDHTWEHPELNNVLSRAIGLDPRVLLDFSDGELMLNDRFLLVSDGVWGVLPDVLMTEILLDHPDPQAAAAALTSLALAHGGTTMRRRWSLISLRCHPPTCVTAWKWRPVCPCHIVLKLAMNLTR